MTHLYIADSFCEERPLVEHGLFIFRVDLLKENLKNIFMPNFTKKAGGIGLGLSTTMNILNSNHATVEVQSEEGKGTRFILSFGNSYSSNTQ